jgi:hypothetical protein
LDAKLTVKRLNAVSLFNQHVPFRFFLIICMQKNLAFVHIILLTLN